MNSIITNAILVLCSLVNNLIFYNRQFVMWSVLRSGLTKTEAFDNIDADCLP